MDLVFGMRGHAQMIPFGVNTRIISLGTHKKLKYFLQDIGALDWYIDINQEKTFLKEKILSQFEEVNEKNKYDTDRRLIESQNKIFEITAKNTEKIEKILIDYNFKNQEKNFKNFDYR
jgi:polysaccharide pyruvyl transferase WcaK-like protein